MCKMKTIFQVSLKEEALSLHHTYILKANVLARAGSSVGIHNTFSNSSTALGKVYC